MNIQITDRKQIQEALDYGIITKETYDELMELIELHDNL